MASKRTRDADIALRKAIIIAGCTTLIIVMLVLAGWVIDPPDLNFSDCASLQPQSCGCPETFGAGHLRRSVVFLDATNAIPSSRRQDLKELLRAFTTPMSLWDSVTGSQERVSVFVYSKQSPDQLTPVASFCRLPNEAPLSIKYSSAQIDEYQEHIQNAASQAIAASMNTADGRTSNLVQGLAVVTGSAAYWNNQGRMFFLSDLVERSPECGYFDRSVPGFSQVNERCKSYITRAAESMRGAAVSVCMLPRSDQVVPAGVIPFWQEYFQSTTGHPPSYSCDPELVKKQLLQ